MAIQTDAVAVGLVRIDEEDDYDEDDFTSEGSYEDLGGAQRHLVQPHAAVGFALDASGGLDCKGKVSRFVRSRCQAVWEFEWRCGSMLLFMWSMATIMVRTRRHGVCRSRS